MLQGLVDAAERQAGAVQVVLQCKALAQAKRIQHVLERQIGTLHIFVLRQCIALQGGIHVAGWIAQAHLAHYAVGKAQFAVRASANAQVIAKRPVVAVVHTRVARLGIG
ncbi:hypothetical protein D3C72_1968820 [compost metagenome]